MELEEEQRFFEQHRREWLAEHQGKFALIKESTLIGTFDTAENAYVAGVQKFGNVPFLIKQILEEEPVIHLPALSSPPFRAFTARSTPVA
jgi:hypothetical protein